MPPPVVAGFNPRTGGREPVELGLAASRRLGAPLIVVSVVPDRALAAVAGRDEGRDAVALDALRVDLRREGSARVEVVEAGTAGAGLIAALERIAPLFVALGTTSRGGVASAILGTTVERVMHGHVCPVAVVPRGHRAPAGGLAVIGAAFAPTAEGHDALETAAALARRSGARLRAITVLGPSLRERATGALPTAADRLREAVPRLGDDIEVELDVRHDDAAAGLLAAAAGLDLLVVGSRAHAAQRTLALGSVSRRVAERAACPVLVLPRGGAEAMRALAARGASLPAA